MKKKSGDKAWALLEKYVGPLTPERDAWGDQGVTRARTCRRRPLPALPGAACAAPRFTLDALIGRVAEALGAVLVVGRDLHPVCRRRLALRLRQPAHVDRRTRHLSVPVAGDARRRRRAAPRRAHAADHLCQLGVARNGAAGSARSPRWWSSSSSSKSSCRPAHYLRGAAIDRTDHAWRFPTAIGSSRSWSAPG